LDKLCVRLDEQGLANEGRRISFLLHQVPWTTTSELFGELESAIRLILASGSPALLADIREELTAYLQMLEAL